MTKKTRSNLKQAPLWQYVYSHVQGFNASVKHLWCRPWLTLVIAVVLGIAMALPVGLYLLLQEAKTLTHHWNNKPHIALYLENTVVPAQQQNLLKRLQSYPNIAHAQLITPEEGLRLFTQYSGFKDITQYITDNPLPPVIEVEPANNLATLQGMEQLVNVLQGLPEVNIAQLNHLWVERLYGMMQLLQRCLYGLGFIFSVGVVFIVGSIIHLALERGREEVEILRLLGATTAFIRRPFLYRGFLYGLLGASVAAVLIGTFLFCLQAPVNHLAYLYHSDFQLSALSGSYCVGLLCFGAVLGMAGAYFALKPAFKFK